MMEPAVASTAGQQTRRNHGRRGGGLRADEPVRRHAALPRLFLFRYSAAAGLGGLAAGRVDHADNQIGCSTWNIVLHFEIKGLDVGRVGFVGNVPRRRRVSASGGKRESQARNSRCGGFDRLSLSGVVVGSSRDRSERERGVD